MYRKESDFTDYGKGSPGYNWEVRLYRDGVRIARAFGPNVNGPNIGEFADMDAVRAAKAMPDGSIADDVDVLSMLDPYYADRVSATDDLVSA